LYLGVVARPGRDQHIAWHLSHAEQALETINHWQRREAQGYTSVRHPFGVTKSDLAQGSDAFDHCREVLILHIDGQTGLIEGNPGAW